MESLSSITVESICTLFLGIPVVFIETVDSSGCAFLIPGYFELVAIREGKNMDILGKD